ncbi:GATA zinc finger-domain-containing protein, partial [Dimargaris cristalligena]
MPLLTTGGPATLTAPSHCQPSTSAAGANQPSAKGRTKVLAFPSYNSKGEMKKCGNCFVINTPSWRRSKDGTYLLCNACGLYYKLHNHARP